VTVALMAGSWKVPYLPSHTMLEENLSLMLRSQQELDYGCSRSQPVHDLSVEHRGKTDSQQLYARQMASSDIYDQHQQQRYGSAQSQLVHDLFFGEHRDKIGFQELAGRQMPSWGIYDHGNVQFQPVHNPRVKHRGIVDSQELDVSQMPSSGIYDQHLQQRDGSAQSQLDHDLFVEHRDISGDLQPTVKQRLPSGVYETTIYESERKVSSASSYHVPDLVAAPEHKASSPSTLTRSQMITTQTAEGSMVILQDDTVYTNPGSLRHPELCMRACIFFATNQCMKGEDCGFCHMLHKARADKQQRNRLKSMDFRTMLVVLLPLLLEKAQSPEASDLWLIEPLQKLASSLEPWDSTEQTSKAANKRLMHKLANTPLRVLLKMLFRTAQAEELKPETDRILQCIRDEVFGSECFVGPRADLPPQHRPSPLSEAEVSHEIFYC